MFCVIASPDLSGRGNPRYYDKNWKFIAQNHNFNFKIFSDNVFFFIEVGFIQPETGSMNRTPTFSL